MSERLVVFAKEPLVGRVKTRLAAEVGSVLALRLYEAFLADLSSGLFPCNGAWEAVLAHDGDAPGPVLRSLFGAWSFDGQGEGSLGERLTRVFERARSSVDRTVVVGSDAPTLSRVEAEAAFEALRTRCDVVFAPSPDGGYALVGLRRHVLPETVFESVRWSTPDALADSLRGAARRGHSVELLAPIPDVDVSGDLEVLRQRLVGEGALAPSTRRVLLEERSS